MELSIYSVSQSIVDKLCSTLTQSITHPQILVTTLRIKHQKQLKCNLLNEYDLLFIQCFFFFI